MTALPTAGPAPAFAPAIAAEMPGLLRRARLLTGCPHAAEDLVQDTLQRALERAHQFTLGTNLRAWLFAILRTQHLNECRRAALRPQPADNAVLDSVPSYHASGPARVELRELMARIAALPEEKRIVVLLAADGASYAELAQRTGVPEGTAKSRLCRARAELAAGMDPDAQPSARRPA